jgi:hypothetical protein
MKIDGRYVWFLFAAAASCIVLKSILRTWMLASAATHARRVEDLEYLPAVYYTSGKGELGGLVSLLCIIAFVTWSYLIWTSPNSVRKRLLQWLLAFLASSLIFIGIAIALGFP